MDILFIDPPWIIKNETNLWKQVRSCWPTLGVAYIASYLEQFELTCKIIDCTAERIAVTDFEDRLIGECPRFIGITATTPLISNGLKIAEICKVFYPHTKIVFGGVHPTVLTEEVLQDENVDYVVRGEGEETTKELLMGRDPAEISGLSYKVRGKIVHNPRRPLIEDLDSLPPPAYHLLPMKKYYPAIGSYKRLPAMSIISTRGCPGKCTFCYRIFGRKVRRRSAEKIMEEVRILQNQYGVREISFYDDTFTIHKREVERFCHSIMNENIDLTWSCFTRIDYVNEELLRLMKDSGCHLILFGIETSDEQILKNINKKMNLNRIRKIVAAARKIGIETRASYMLGNPGETEETIRKTMAFAKELDTDEVQFNITTAYPGTELFEWAEENGFLRHCNWSDYHMSEHNIDLPSVEREFIQNYYKRSHLTYYLRPKILLRRALHIRSFGQLKQEIHGLFAVLKSSN